MAMVKDAADPWVMEPGDRLDLALEPFDKVRLLCVHAGDDFDGDGDLLLAVEPAPYFAHPARAQRLEQRERAEIDLCHGTPRRISQQ
jgi:hypothetical protein